jgi:Intracellular proteinase inhibitor
MNSMAYVFLTVVFLLSCGEPVTGPFNAEPAPGDASDESELSGHPSTWFPMGAGNVWTFERLGGGGKRQLSVNLSSEGTVELAGLFATPVRMVDASATTLTGLRGDETVPTPFLRFSGRRRWTFGQGPCSGYQVQRLPADSSPLTTSAGLFASTRQFAFSWITSPTVRCAQPAIESLTVAPGIGPVSFRTGAGDTYVLLNASVNTLTVPATSPLIATVSFSQSTYLHGPAGAGCAQTPCAGDVETALAELSYTVRNTTGRRVTIPFSSGCQVNVRLLTPTGEVIRNEEVLRDCVPLASTLTLAPNESRLFTESVPLSNMDGDKLLSGAFTAVVYLTTSMGPLAPASAHLTVRAP